MLAFCIGQRSYSLGGPLGPGHVQVDVLSGNAVFTTSTGQVALRNTCSATLLISKRDNLVRP